MSSHCWQLELVLSGETERVASREMLLLGLEEKAAAVWSVKLRVWKEIAVWSRWRLQVLHLVRLPIPHRQMRRLQQGRLQSVGRFAFSVGTAAMVQPAFRPILRRIPLLGAATLAGRWWAQQSAVRAQRMMQQLQTTERKRRNAIGLQTANERPAQWSTRWQSRRGKGETAEV